MKAKTFLTAIITTMIVLTACQKASDELFDLDFDRAFRPTGLDIEWIQTVGEGMRPRVTWVASQNADSYIVHLTRDTSFATYDIFEVVGTTFLAPEIIPFNTWIGFRIKAVSNDGTTDDSKWDTHILQVAPEQLLFPLLTADVLSMSVRLRWIRVSDVSTITITDNTTPDEDLVDLGIERTVTIQLTPEAIDTAGLFVGNLNPGTQFTVRIYRDIWMQQPRGELTFTTRPGVNCNWDHVVCFPFSSDSIQNGIDLRELMQNSDNIGRIIYLPEGFVAIMPSAPGEGSWGVNIAGTMHIFGNSDGERPRIVFEGSAAHRLFRLPASADSIVFENLEIVGRAGAHRYLINQTELTTIGTLRFENTRLDNFGEGGIRLQGEGAGPPHHIGNIIINRSEISRFSHERVTGRFAFIHAGNAGTNHVRIDHIAIRNSTFSEMDHSLLDIGGNTDAQNQVTQSVTIENSTFDRVVGAGSSRYLIQGQTWSNMTVVIRNSIFASTLSDEARGIQISPVSTPMVVENSFRTADWVTNPLIGDPPRNVDIPNLGAFPGGRTDLFVDPNNGNFRFNADVEGAIRTAGDPRWRE